MYRRTDGNHPPFYRLSYIIQCHPFSSSSSSSSSYLLLLILLLLLLPLLLLLNLLLLLLPLLLLLNLLLLPPPLLLCLLLILLLLLPLLLLLNLLLLPPPLPSSSSPSSPSSSSSSSPSSSKSLTEFVMLNVYCNSETLLLILHCGRKLFTRPALLVVNMSLIRVMIISISNKSTHSDGLECSNEEGWKLEPTNNNSDEMINLPGYPHRPHLIIISSDILTKLQSPFDCIGY